MTMTRSTTTNYEDERERSIDLQNIDHVPPEWDLCMRCNRWQPTDDEHRCTRCGHDVWEA